MVWHGLLAKAATTVVTGAVGVAAYDGLRKVVANSARLIRYELDQ